jgi:hypothetical protein
VVHMNYVVCREEDQSSCKSKLGSRWLKGRGRRELLLAEEAGGSLVLSWLCHGCVDRCLWAVVPFTAAVAGAAKIAGHILGLGVN